MLKRFIFEEEGQTLVEYGLLISLIALIAVVGVALFGGKIKNSLYTNISNQIDK